MTWLNCENMSIATLQWFALEEVGSVAFHHNNFRRIPPGTFDAATRLILLSIYDTNLTVIVPGVFSNLPCHYLYLSSNKISMIEREAFSNMAALLVLDLSNNALTEFNGTKIFGRADNLTKLSLQQNRMTAINKYSFRAMRNLQYLNLGNNLISSVRDKTFAANRKLKILLMSNNHLKVLNPNMFSSTTINGIVVLSVTANRLQYLSLAFLSRLSSLKLIDLVENPWRCTCLGLIFQWIRDKDIEIGNFHSDYFNGSRPICVDSASLCSYSYKEDDYELYAAASKEYKKQEESYDVYWQFNWLQDDLQYHFSH